MTWCAFQISSVEWISSMHFYKPGYFINKEWFTFLFSQPAMESRDLLCKKDERYKFRTNIEIRPIYSDGATNLHLSFIHLSISFPLLECKTFRGVLTNKHIPLFPLDFSSSS